MPIESYSNKALFPIASMVSIIFPLASSIYLVSAVVLIGYCITLSIGFGRHIAAVSVGISRGPTLDRVRKPDLIAPGVNIMSLSNKNLTSYTTLSGTSMSAPMVSGAAALLLNENPNYTHYDIKRKLLNACTKIKASSIEQGAGILDISRIFS
ncbi:MAG: S8 family serine peptidase [Sedimentibacter sp.]|uniref:S8 family serine peptidase n=1 Tax=Sedimentibacter sp. TaxID=1960295 RepID=UPI0031598426